MSASDSPQPPDLAALSPWAAELAKTFVSLASDIALVIDDAGVIRTVVQGGAEPIAPTAHEWVGRAWIDTVSGDTRRKIEHLLSDVNSTGLARRREVNHPLSAETTVPVAYTAVRLGAHGPVLAVGRDLRAVAAIQQRYVESQQGLERGYWQARQAEARYQVLFQVATDAVVVVDAESLNVIEANLAAARLFGTSIEQLPGRPLSAGFEHHARGAVNELLASARASGRSGEIRARLQGTTQSASVAATPFRADDAMRLLVRVRAIDAASAPAALNQTLAQWVDEASDGIVVTDSSGRVLLANRSFLRLVHASHESDVKGRALAGWLDAGNDPLTAIVPTVRRDGLARRLEAWVRRADAPPLRVDVSAALMTEGDQECIGFSLRPAAPPGAPDGAATGALHAGLEQLGARLGELDLAAVLREAAALAESHFVRLALQRCDGDAAAAARLLGVSGDAPVLRRRGSASAGGADPAATNEAP